MKTLSNPTARTKYQTLGSGGKTTPLANAVLKDFKYTLVPIAAAACTYFLDAATVVNINLGIPTPVAGQYYKVVTYYSNYKAYVETTIWNNKNAYDVGADPIYSGTVSTPLVQP